MISLKDVNTGQPKKPPRIVLIGEEGIGKSTFGNNSPLPIFLCSEDGLVGADFWNTPNITPMSWPQTLDFIKALINDDHPYKTLVIDTIDWIEPLLNDFICKNDNKKNIEEFGYGKGHLLAAIEWRSFLSLLEKLRSKKNMIILINAHCQIKTFSNPIGDNYDRYEMKVSKQISSLTREWADAVLFSKYEVYTIKEGNKAKGYSDSKRVVFTNKSVAWDAKNRYGMPEKLPLDFNDVIQAIENGQPDTENSVIEEINDIMKNSTIIKTEEKEAIKKYIKENSKNISNLRRMLNRVRTKST